MYCLLNSPRKISSAVRRTDGRQANGRVDGRADERARGRAGGRTCEWYRRARAAEWVPLRGINPAWSEDFQKYFCSSSENLFFRVIHRQRLRRNDARCDTSGEIIGGQRLLSNVETVAISIVMAKKIAVN